MFKGYMKTTAGQNFSRGSVYGFSNTAGYGGQSGGNFKGSAQGLTLNTDQGMLEGIIDNLSENRIRGIYRDIYWHDTVAGSAVDLMANIPFGDFSLTGVYDSSIIQKYKKSIENIKLRSMLPGIVTDKLVQGTHISVINFDQHKKVYKNIIPVNIDLCSLQQTPFYGDDPIIDVKFEKDMQNFINRTKDQRYNQYRKKMPEWLIDGIKKGGMQLDPLNTLYLPRRSMTTSGLGVSLFRRMLAIFALEKTLLRGTIEMAHRRQRAIGHVVCLTGDTLIYVNEELKRIDSICSREGLKENEGYNVDFVTKGKDGELVNVTNWWYRGKKQVNKVTTKSGYNLKATDDHRLLVLGEDARLVWKEVQEIQKGDFLCIDPNFNPNFNPNSSDSKNENYLNLEYDLVSNIEPLKEKQDVYDLTVDHHHEPAFVANGIISHNCGDQDWVPTDEELNNIANLFGQADQDPIGAIVATRQGVNLNEIRRGGDFWGYEDIYEFSAQAKMRAMGINERFLCLPGDTKITTDKGQQDLNKLIDEKDLNALKKQGKDSFLDINVNVKTRDGKWGRAVKFWYRGISSNILTSYSFFGKTLKTTPDHRILVVGENFEILWKKAKDLNQEKDWFCIDNNEKDLRLEETFNLDKNNSFEILNNIIKNNKIPDYVFFLNTRGRLNLLKTIIYKSSRVDKVVNYNNVFILELDLFKNKKLKNELMLLFYSVGINTVVYKNLLYIEKTKSNKNSLKSLDISLKNLDKTKFSNIPKYMVIEFFEKHIVSKKEGIFKDNRGNLVELDYSNLFYNEIFDKNHIGKEIDNFNDITFKNIENFYIKNSYVDILLEAVGKLDSTARENLTFLKEKDYIFDKFIFKLSSIKDINVELFDLTMEEEESPAFVANSFVVHNSGDINFSNSEMALSVFMEQIKNMRNEVTEEVFYEKMFPIIAYTNGFRRDKREKMVTGSKVEERKDKHLHKIESSVNSDILEEMGDITQYEIPKVNWHKRLEPIGDRDHMDMLQQLDEQWGIPIPARMAAAASGVSIDEILNSVDDDEDIRKELSAQNKKIDKIMGKDEEGGGGGLGFASVNGGAVPRRNPMSREQEPYGEYFEIDEKTDKPRRVSKKRRKQISEKVNRNLSEAASSIAEQKQYQRKNKKKE